MSSRRQSGSMLPNKSRPREKKESPPPQAGSGLRYIYVYVLSDDNFFGFRTLTADIEAGGGILDAYTLEVVVLGGGGCDAVDDGFELSAVNHF